ncbi:protein Mpv17-like [Corticium candelabrum]|uniref:protein Mpv17-like n=1 Tax=Corticium candelabrum TaxID=121492 RepID=UPI002E25DE60|nr:protein Mpv17-like [Corticium candelabrum]
MRLWSWYTRLLSTYPLLTQASTAGVITMVGDIIAQQCIERKGIKNHKFGRSIKMGTIGLFFTGPVLRFWYIRLDKLVPGTPTLPRVVKRIALDQAIFAPLFLASFFVLLAGVERKTRQEIWNKLKQNYYQALAANYMLWPAAQALTFSVVPLRHRVGFVSLVALIWNTYLAWVAHRYENY